MRNNTMTTMDKLTIMGYSGNLITTYDNAKSHKDKQLRAFINFNSNKLMVAIKEDNKITILHEIQMDEMMPENTTLEIQYVSSDILLLSTYIKVSVVFNSVKKSDAYLIELNTAKDYKLKRVVQSEIALLAFLKNTETALVYTVYGKKYEFKNVGLELSGDYLEIWPSMNDKDSTMLYKIEKERLNLKKSNYRGYVITLKMSSVNYIDDAGNVIGDMRYTKLCTGDIVSKKHIDTMITEEIRRDSEVRALQRSINETQREICLASVDDKGVAEYRCKFIETNMPDYFRYEPLEYEERMWWWRQQ